MLLVIDSHRGMYPCFDFGSTCMLFLLCALVILGKSKWNSLISLTQVSFFLRIFYKCNIYNVSCFVFFVLFGRTFVSCPWYLSSMQWFCAAAKLYNVINLIKYCHGYCSEWFHFELYNDNCVSRCRNFFCLQPRHIDYTIWEGYQRESITFFF